MVHNGIEYGMMEAIGEGYGVMKASNLDLDLLQVTKIYQQGSVVRGWLIDLVRNIFEHEDIEGTKGEINMLGEGEWTVEAGKIGNRREGTGRRGECAQGISPCRKSA